jgi:hypothetical protein
MKDQLRRLFLVLSLFALIYITIGLSLQGGYNFLRIGAWLAFWMAYGVPFVKKRHRPPHRARACRLGRTGADQGSSVADPENFG